MSIPSRGAVTALVVVSALVVFSGFAPAEEAEEKEQPTKLFKMDAENWQFIPNSITVRQGTKVVLKIRGFHAPHRFDLKAYGLKVPIPQKKTTTIEFVADKAGKFRWRCGRPCGDGCAKMTGKLTVLEAPPETPSEGS